MSNFVASVFLDNDQECFCVPHCPEFAVTKHDWVTPASPLSQIFLWKDCIQALVKLQALQMCTLLSAGLVKSLFIDRFPRVR